MPCAVFGSRQLQLALPTAVLEWLDAASGLPASLPVQETCPLTPFPVCAFLTVNKTLNDLPATALPTVGLLAVSLSFAGGGGGGGGGGGAALTVIVRVVETLPPESSVTVNLAVNVPAAVY